MSTKNENAAVILKACNDKINILRDEQANMFQVSMTGRGNAFMTIATFYLKPNNAYKCKQAVIKARVGMHSDINFVFDEAHLVHFHSDPDKNTHEYLKDDVIGLNLEQITALAMTGDTLKNWVKMKNLTA